MSTVDKALVERLANLSRLQFSETEVSTLQGQLSNILNFISQLQEVNTDGVEPMASVIEGMSTRERDDVVSEQDRRDAYLNVAPQSEMGFYVVPRVVE